MLNLLFRISLIPLACSLLVGCSLLTRRIVVFEGTSMMPTIKDGEKLHTERLDAESKTKLVRGDIIVYHKRTAQAMRSTLVGCETAAVALSELPEVGF